MQHLSRWIVLAAVVSMFGCSTSKPVLNFDNQPIPGKHTAGQVRTAIAAAATNSAPGTNESDFLNAPLPLYF